MEFDLVSDTGTKYFSAYNIVAFCTMLTRILYGPRSARGEYVPNQGGASSEGPEPPKTGTKKYL